MGERLRGRLMLAGAVVLIMVLPIIALTDYFGPMAKLVGQIVLSILLILAIIGSGLFGYICIKAQARKWGAGLLVGAVLCTFIIFWIWTGRLILFI
jgi:hypothetical protein